MSDVAIRVENLGKRYRVGNRAEQYGMLRDTLARTVRDPLRTLKRRGGNGTNDFWALRDVSFEVKHGDVLGIIGRNGAGKSTLLKVLSRITEPTSGRAEIRGRVGSLLEVGTGFHPELTGRENIYLNGAILGMKKSEIDRKFDAIVDFAEIGRFLDTPVKRYSSGMHVRLAFAVAAHLESEVLLVDEVLAVGDAAFQQRCIGKISEITREGRTVLFVSHNMASILSLCSTVQWLDAGTVALAGKPEDVVTGYLQAFDGAATIPVSERLDRAGDGSARISTFAIRNIDGTGTVRCSDALDIEIGYSASADLLRPRFIVGIYDQLGRRIFCLDSSVTGNLHGRLPQTGTVRCVTGPINLTAGPCNVHVDLFVDDALADSVENVCQLNVETNDFYGTGKLQNRQSTLCLLPHEWSLEGKKAPTL